jgi:alanine-synthesizing transaminase
MYIGKSEKIKNVRYELRGRISDQADALVAQGVDVIRLNIGNPGAFGFQTTLAVEQSLAAHAAASVPYSGTKGLPQTRAAIAQYHRNLGLQGVDEEDIFTGNGVSELIQITLQALLNSGDEVLVPTPDYPLWTAATILAGGKAVHYLCDEAANWCPNIADMRAKITPRTRAICVINPNNPTGAVYTKEVLQQIAQLAREHNLVLLADEIYDRLVMDDALHVPLAALAPDLFCVTRQRIH